MASSTMKAARPWSPERERQVRKHIAELESQRVRMIGHRQMLREALATIDALRTPVCGVCGFGGEKEPTPC